MIKTLSKKAKELLVKKYKNKLIYFNYLFNVNERIAVILDVSYDYNFGATLILFSEGSIFKAPILHIEFEVIQ
tara:strand:- start:1715 stop:1933 length:219 start_codon:yes stop_codon:yes gene_type:complete